MSISPRTEILARRAGRLLRFRVPLIVAVAFNAVLLVRIPLAEVLPGSRQAPAQPSAIAGRADRPVEHSAGELPVEKPLAVPDPRATTRHEAGQQFLAQVESTAGAVGAWSAGAWQQLSRSVPGLVNGKRASRSDQGRLRLVNPAANGGEVRLLINGQLHSLPPGGELVEPAGEPWAVQFHRGDELGNAMYSLGPGTYTFRVSERGWNLAPAPWHSLGPTR
ncbi:MAG: hypothetical protein J5I93_15025 [Pirellulaceae bacterium]|nr:hypothetical protein [Pirellulaceae bacterium]